jgi:hypothetical protein
LGLVFSNYPDEEVPSSLKENLMLVIVLKPRAKVQKVSGILFAENTAIALEMAKSLKEDGSTARPVVVVEQ